MVLQGFGPIEPLLKHQDQSGPLCGTRRLRFSFHRMNTGRVCFIWRQAAASGVLREIRGQEYGLVAQLVRARA